MGKNIHKQKSTPKIFFNFNLFIAGDEPNSLQAKKTLVEVCETLPQESYRLNIFDVFNDTNIAVKERIIVVPTLKVIAPKFNRVIIGSLINESELLKFLDLPKL